MEFLGDLWSFFADGDTWTGSSGLLARLRQHVTTSGVAMVIACAVALPIGIFLGHRRRGGTLAVNLSNVGRALPSFALLVLAVQAFGLSSGSIYIALVALAVPPILTNAYVGVAGVDPDIRESAVGMGLRGSEVLRQVELPLAVPLVMAGIRTSAITVVATATIAAVTGEQNLGRYVVDGYAVRDNVRIVAGAIVVAMLSLLTERLLAAVQARLTPRGLSLRAREEGRPAGSLAEAATA
ncbi:MAG: ABC transporter permease [Acidimicrobiia bacterium]|nr:ABC transporter permease [Acidimicrobiia bacterium]